MVARIDPTPEQFEEIHQRCLQDEGVSTIARVMGLPSQTVRRTVLVLKESHGLDYVLNDKGRGGRVQKGIRTASGWKLSAETKKKISESHIGRDYSNQKVPKGGRLLPGETLSGDVLLRLSNDLTYCWATRSQYYRAYRTEQGSLRCDICDSEEPKSVKGFHVDHCHDSDDIRGLLCQLCNPKLGYYQKYKAGWDSYLSKGSTQTQYDPLDTDTIFELLGKEECEVCEKGHDWGKRLHVDHNYETGLVRGVLCYRCNITAEYIEAWKGHFNTYLEGR